MPFRSSPGSQSLRWGFVWNLTGSVAYNFSQWVLLWILARLSAPEEVGQFTYLMALAAPVFLTVGLNLGTVQVTDTTRRYSLDDFFLVRTITNMAAVLLSLGLGALVGIEGSLFWALLFVTLAKSVENVSLSCYGYYALVGRFDVLAWSMLLRAVLGPSAFGGAYAATFELWIACAALALAWLVVGLLFDSPTVRRLAASEGMPRRGWKAARRRNVLELFRRSLPLGLDQGVSSYSINLPRYAVDHVLGPSRLGLYGAQAYLAQVVTMITMAMTGVFVPRLARAYALGDRRSFVRDLVRMCAAGSSLALAGLVMAVLVGEWFLSVTLGPDYANVRLLVLLMLASWFITLQRVLSKGLEASHRFRSYLLVDVVTLLGIAIPLWPLVARFGVDGAALASSFGFALGALVMAVYLSTIVRSMPGSRTRIPNLERPDP